MNTASKEIWENKGLNVVACTDCGRETVTAGYQKEPTCSACAEAKS